MGGKTIQAETNGGLEGVRGTLPGRDYRRRELDKEVSYTC